MLARGDRRRTKSPTVGGILLTGLCSETPYMGMLTDDVLNTKFGALNRIVSDIEESQQAAWVVFFKRLWVGRHASYACERIEALQKWNLHCMGPLGFSNQIWAIFKCGSKSDTVFLKCNLSLNSHVTLIRIHCDLKVTLDRHSSYVCTGEGAGKTLWVVS